MEEKTSKKVSYTKYSFTSMENDNPATASGSVIEGFCKSVRPRVAHTKNGDKNVTDVEINAIVPDKTVEKYFGKAFVNEFHSLRFCVTYWGVAGENLAKYPPQKNQLVLLHVDGMTAHENTAADGRVFRTVYATGINFPMTNSPRKADGESALVASSAEKDNAEPAPAPAKAVGAVNVDDLDDDELPF